MRMALASKAAAPGGSSRAALAVSPSVLSSIQPLASAAAFRVLKSAARGSPW
jgi:hypothetical protein